MDTVINLPSGDLTRRDLGNVNLNFTVLQDYFPLVQPKRNHRAGGPHLSIRVLATAFSLAAYSRQSMTGADRYSMGLELCLFVCLNRGRLKEGGRMGTLPPRETLRGTEWRHFLGCIIVSCVILLKVIYCCLTNYLKTQQLKTANVYYLTDSGGHEF